MWENSLKALSELSGYCYAGKTSHSLIWGLLTPSPLQPSSELPCPEERLLHPSTHGVLPSPLPSPCRKPRLGRSCPFCHQTAALNSAWGSPILFFFSILHPFSFLLTGGPARGPAAGPAAGPGEERGGRRSGRCAWLRGEGGS